MMEENMNIMTKNAAAYQLSDEIIEMRRICRLSRDMAGDTYSHLSDTADRSSCNNDLTSLVGILSGALLESGWKIEVLIELLCSLDERLAQLEVLAKEPDEACISSARDDLLDEIGVDEFNHVLRVITGKDIVSSRDISKLLNICMKMREGAEINV